MSTTAEKFIIEESNMEEITMHKDGNACMKAAFLYYVSKKSVRNDN